MVIRDVLPPSQSSHPEEGFDLFGGERRIRPVPHRSACFPRFALLASPSQKRVPR
jgi:hypothetical protein